MSSNPIAMNFRQACQQVSIELDIEEEIVRKITQCFFKKMVFAFAHELPFSISGFGKFYYNYHKRMSEQVARNVYGRDVDWYKDKVHKELAFSISDSLKHRLNGWVHDLGIRNNVDYDQMAKLAIKPEEIVRIRRSKQLEEQRKLGFNAELLFEPENVPDIDKDIIQKLEKAPTVEQLLARLGINLTLD